MEKKHTRKQQTSPGNEEKKTQEKPQAKIATVLAASLTLKKQMYIALIASVVSYALIFIGRYVLLGSWNDPSMYHCGEPAQITNDVFLFIAGADGFGRGVLENFSTLTRFFHTISGKNYGVLGIWLPVILIPLISFPICWLFALLRHPFAGVVASLFILNAPSFFGRTIPGYYDNDMFDIFFPVTFGATILIILSHLVRDKWWGKDTVTPKEKRIPTYKLWIYASFAGLIAASYTWCYFSRIPVNFVMVFAATVGGLFCLRKGESSRFLGAMAIIWMFIVMPSFPISLAFAVVAIIAAYKWQEDCEERKIGYYLFGGFVLAYLLSGEIQPIIERFITNIGFFGAGASSIASVRTVIPVPSFSLSVSEIQRIPFISFMQTSAYNVPLFILGFFGIVMFFVLRPNAIAFFPLLAIGLSSTFLGARFAIFSCLALGIGFTFLLAEITSRYIERKIIHFFIYCLVALAIFAFTIVPDTKMPPILNKEYAEALCEMRGKTEKGTQFWAWWDWGHAIAYYSRALPFVDGGINELGCYITAVVHTTNSTKTAASIMKYAATTQMLNAMNSREQAKWDAKFARRYEVLGYNSFQAMMPIHHLNDYNYLDKTLGAITASMKEKPGKLPPQYLVLTWDNVRIFNWIGYFGKWDTHQKKSTHPQIARLTPGAYPFDPQRGILTVNNMAIPISSLNVIDNRGFSKKTFPNKQGYNLIQNYLTNEIFVADDTVINSMMYRMLVEEPRLFSEHFEIVVDHFPMARIYRLKG